jgi:serine/threonine protein kinase
MKPNYEKNTAHGRPKPPSGTATAVDTSFDINVLPAGVRLAEFEIIRLIDDSGFDIAYLACDHALDRHVRLKEYLPSGIALRTRAMNVTVKSPAHAEPFHAGMRSFLDEARLLSQMDCPSLIKVDSFWEANGVAYMVMPFYGGIPLKQAFEQRSFVPDETWIRKMLADLLDAVEAIHRARSVHFDISPDTIVLPDDGRPLLLEPGASRRVVGHVTRGRSTLLKPGFAPIELYLDTPGFKHGPWTDVYAVAAVTYFLLSGKPPPIAAARLGKDEMTPARIVGKGRYSESFLAALDHALAVRPEQRFRSVGAMREALGVGAPTPRALPSHAPAGTSAFLPGRDSHTVTQPAGQERLHAMLAEESTHKSGLSRSKAMVSAGVLAAGVIAGASVYWFMASPARAPGPAETVETAGPAASSPERTVSAPSATAQSDGNGINPQERPYAGQSASDALRPPESAAVERPAVTKEPAPPPAASASAASPAPGFLAPTPNPAVPRVSPEEELWKAALASNEVSGYERYLKRYPSGRFAAIAKSRLERIQSRTAAAAAPPPSAAAAPREFPASPEELAWKTAVAINEEPAYESYLSSFPRGPNAGAAREQLARLRAAETARLATAAKPKASAAAPAAAPTAAPAAAPTAAPTAESGASPAPVAANNPRAPQVEEAKALPDPVQPATRKTLRLADQTITGDFTTDPATGLATGRVRIDWNNGDRFDGNLVRGRKEGKGRFTWSNGQTYSGDWSNDQPNGRGTFLFANGNRYDGEVRDGLPHGQGTTRFRGGDMYSGSWARGKTNGHGRYTWISGSYWEGEFRNDTRTENGRMVFSEKALSAPSAASGG